MRRGCISPGEEWKFGIFGIEYDATPVAFTDSGVGHELATVIDVVPSDPFMKDKCNVDIS